mmetsp:Transcript_2406/g.6102  ORF Transcript_2406/g.6102 Transcript_2406/m.6102 type:complete len:251 (+) Transcript_2406:425-1177(+)
MGRRGDLEGARRHLVHCLVAEPAVPRCHCPRLCRAHQAGEAEAQRAGRRGAGGGRPGVPAAHPRLRGSHGAGGAPQRVVCARFRFRRGGRGAPPCCRRGPHALDGPRKAEAQALWGGAGPVVRSGHGAGAHAPLHGGGVQGRGRVRGVVRAGAAQPGIMQRVRRGGRHRKAPRRAPLLPARGGAVPGDAGCHRVLALRGGRGTLQGAADASEPAPLLQGRVPKVPPRDRASRRRHPALPQRGGAAPRPPS